MVVGDQAGDLPASDGWVVLSDFVQWGAKLRLFDDLLNSNDDTGV
jgi:hypothetical protein